MVESLDLGGSKHRYEVRPVTPHDHLVDLTTGEIHEFRDPELDVLKRKIARRYGYRLDSQCTFYRPGITEHS